MTLGRVRWNSRGELRLALLAAAESCWMFAIVYTLGALAGFGRVVSPLGIFLVYMTGLYVGRFLPRSQKEWRLLQIATVLFALLAILVAMRVGFYTDVVIYDPTWVPTYFVRIFTFFESLSPEVISTVALIYAYTRALRFSQHALTLWMVGFQFRLGIVVFFVATIIAALTTRVDFIVWIFVYFGLSLAGIALARIEEGGQERPLGPKWALVMTFVLGVTLLCGFIATQVLTLETVDAFFGMLSPLLIVVQILLTLIFIPLFYILEFVLGLLNPLFELLRNAMSNMFPPLHLQNENVQQVINEVTRQLFSLTPYLRLIGVILVFLFVGWLIARALNRRVKFREQEVFQREDLDAEAMLQEKQPRAGTRGRARREISAENVRRLYAAVLAHAEGLGLARRDAETPIEFLPRLAGRFPDAAADLETITNAYVAVHYAQRSASEEQVRELKAVWKRAREEMTKDERRRTKDGKQ